MKIIGALFVCLGLASVWFAIAPLSVGVHAASDLKAPIDPLIDAALDAAKSPEETHQRYQEVAAFRKGLEAFALDAAEKANAAGLALAGIGGAQLVLGIALLLAWKGPNQPTQRNAGSRPSSGDSPASKTPSSLGPRG